MRRSTAIMPVLWKSMPVMNMVSGLADPEVTIALVVSSRLSGFGEVGYPTAPSSTWHRSTPMRS